MIKQYQTPEELAAAGLPESESRIAQVLSTRNIVSDGVNVIKDTPELGDAIYADAAGNIYIIDKDSLRVALLPAGWTYKGPFLYMYDNETMAIFKGDYTSLPTYKYADVVQFSISAISATSIKFWLHMAGDYAAWVPIEVTLTSAEINATSASEIAAALEAAGNTGNVGYDKHKYWAYLADANGNKVDSDGTQIVVQCDNWFDYRQYQCADSTHALVGCTMALSVWGDMPASNTYFKRNGQTTNTKGVMNIAGGAAYWSTNGRTPNTDVAVHGEAGQTDPMTKAAYQSSAYAAAIRAYYPTYEAYLEGEFGLMWPQLTYGAFNLPDGKAMTEKYGPMTATIKDGTTKAKFPALAWAYGLGNSNHLWDVREGTIIMNDANLAAINATQKANGKVQIAASSNRWFAERYYVFNAWVFGGYTRTLTNTNVLYTSQVGAVTLLKK